MNQPAKIVILVTGAFNSGKTEVIRAVSEIPPASVEPIYKDKPHLRILAFGFGRVTLNADALLLYFFGRPGSFFLTATDWLDYFPPEKYHRTGILCICDSTKKSSNSDDYALYERFHEDRQHLKEAQKTGFPYIILANKQDKEGARSPDELRAILDIPDDVPIFPVSAKTDPASVKPAVLELLKRMPQDDIVKTAIEIFPI